MTIYGRFGDVVTIKRRAVLADVQALDGRKPDAQDRAALEAGSYVVVVQDDGTDRLYHQAFLRATDGFREIAAALEALDAAHPAEPVNLAGLEFTPPSDPKQAELRVTGRRPKR